MQTAKTLIIIPARYASSRFPAKPLAPIAGPDGRKSLIQRSYEAAARVDVVTADIVVATDDDRIASHVQGFGGQVVMTSTAAQNGTERCAEVAALSQGYDFYVNFQGDAPLIPPWFVQDVLNALTASDADMATPVLRCDGAMRQGLLADRAAGRVGGTTAVFDAGGTALYFSKEVIPFSAQTYLGTAPTPVFHHVGLYAYRPAALRAYTTWPIGPLEANEGLEQLRFIEQGHKVRCCEVDAKGRQFWEVNNQSDVAIVESMLTHNRALP